MKARWTDLSLIIEFQGTGYLPDDLETSPGFFNPHSRQISVSRVHNEMTM